MDIQSHVPRPGSDPLSERSTLCGYQQRNLSGIRAPHSGDRRRHGDDDQEHEKFQQPAGRRGFASAECTTV